MILILIKTFDNNFLSQETSNRTAEESCIKTTSYLDYERDYERQSDLSIGTGNKQLQSNPKT